MENMLRGITLSLVIVLCLNVLCSSAGTTRNLSLERKLEEELIAPQSTQNITNEMIVRQSREIGNILIAIKSQFRDIIESVISEVWNSIINFISQIKENLLKKLQAFTVSDVLRVVFDSFTDSTANLEPELYIDTVVEPVEVGWEEVYRNPYSLTSLLNDD